MPAVHTQRVYSAVPTALACALYDATFHTPPLHAGAGASQAERSRLKLCCILQPESAQEDFQRKLRRLRLEKIADLSRCCHRLGGFGLVPIMSVHGSSHGARLGRRDFLVPCARRSARAAAFSAAAARLSASCCFCFRLFSVLRLSLAHCRSGR